MKQFFRWIFPVHGYWRTAPFAEMVQLYVARFLRTVAQHLISAFVVIFLYQNGYSLSAILLMVACYYGLRVIISYLTAYLVAWTGPKQAMLISNIFAVPSLLALASLEQYMVVSVAIYFIFDAFSTSVMTIATDTQFSSIKNDHQAGKQLGWMHIAEKIGTGLAPLAGGLMAYSFGPESIMWVAAGLMIVAALPLFMTPERIRRKQRVIYHGLPIRRIGWQLSSSFSRGADQVVSDTVWVLFIAIAVFGTADNSVYAKVGLFLSVSFVASLVVSRLYGVLIDRRRGGELLRAGVLLDVAVHATRPFVSSPVAIGAVNIANEVGTAAHSMPYMRAEYDFADNLPGYRVVYISTTMVFFCFGAAILALVGAVLVHCCGDVEGMKYTFFVMAVVGLLVLKPGFSSLRSQG